MMDIAVNGIDSMALKACAATMGNNSMGSQRSRAVAVRSPDSPTLVPTAMAGPLNKSRIRPARVVAEGKNAGGQNQQCAEIPDAMKSSSDKSQRMPTHRAPSNITARRAPDGQEPRLPAPKHQGRAQQEGRGFYDPDSVFGGFGFMGKSSGQPGQILFNPSDSIARK